MSNWWEKDPNDKGPQFKYKDLPVFKKGLEVLQTVYTIFDLVNEDEKEENDLLKDAVRIMLEDAQIVLAKIAGAEGADLYGLKIENAYIIKSHARNIQATSNLLEMSAEVDDSYIQLLRNQVDDFRQTFLDWVNGFDPTNDVKGEWDFH